MYVLKIDLYHNTLPQGSIIFEYRMLLPRID